MVSTRKKKRRNRKLLTPLNESLDDFIVDNSTSADIAENETLCRQTINLVKDFGRSTVDRKGPKSCHEIETNFAYRIKKAVADSVTAVEIGFGHRSNTKGRNSTEVHHWVISTRTEQRGSKY